MSGDSIYLNFTVIDKETVNWLSFYFRNTCTSYQILKLGAKDDGKNVLTPIKVYYCNKCINE